MTKRPPPSRDLRLLEEAVAEETARTGARTLRALDREILWNRLLDRAEGFAGDRVIERATESSRSMLELLDLPQEERDGWIEARAWTEDALALGERLLDEADLLPLGARLPLARLAARVTLLTPVSGADRLFRARVDDVLGRALLLEVRALRRRGQLDEARQRFAEVEMMFAEDPAPLYFWLTLAGERALTMGLLLRDDGLLTPAAAALHRAAKLFAVAGTEEEDFEVLQAQVRTDLLRGDAARALDRLSRAPVLTADVRRRETSFLRAYTALRSPSPLLARHALLGLLSVLSRSRTPRDLDRFRLADAAAKLAEGQPTAALDALAGPAERLRAEGFLVGSLRAALVACRAELAQKRKPAARAALAAGVLERFSDLPDVPAVRSVLAAVAEHAAGPLDFAFLQRLDLWLILAEDSPGVGLPDSPNSRS